MCLLVRMSPVAILESRWQKVCLPGNWVELGSVSLRPVAAQERNGVRKEKGEWWMLWPPTVSFLLLGPGFLNFYILPRLGVPVSNIFQIYCLSLFSLITIAFIQALLCSQLNSSQYPSNPAPAKASPRLKFKFLAWQQLLGPFMFRHPHPFCSCLPPLPHAWLAVLPNSASRSLHSLHSFSLLSSLCGKPQPTSSCLSEVVALSKQCGA